jgi:hypothetical protein
MIWCINLKLNKCNGKYRCTIDYKILHYDILQQFTNFGDYIYGLENLNLPPRYLDHGLLFS